MNFLDRTTIAKLIAGTIKNNRRLVYVLAVGIFVFSFAMFARGAGIRDPNHNPSKYTSLMREVNELKAGKGDAIKKAETVKNLDEFISGEKARLDDLGVSGAKQKVYFKTLESQLKAINEGSAGEKSFFSDWFGVGDEQQNTVENVDKKLPEAKLPKNPAKFQFSPDPGKVTKLENAKIIPQSKQKLSNELLKLVTIEKAQAVEENVLPVLEDVKADDKEIKITPEIRELAMKLKNNPVEIVNFVRNSVTYEPYYGAKKGSEGCLEELVCNDIDASSLTIALLRAAGIPARYRKSAAIFTVAQLQNLLGVDQTKTAYIALANNGVPVHVLTDLLNNIPFKDADFSQERFLAVEWTHVQAFYEYDERGANMENAMNFTSAATTQDVRNVLQNLPKKQWIPIDAIVKPYARTARQILADTAGFNAENFWNSFFQYQGGLSPLGKYKQDIANATGQQIENNLSEKTSPKKNFDILPITLPYAVASAANQNVQIPVEKFSVLPETYRVKVRISLRRDANDEVVMSRTFAASEINNARINLSYEGATDVSKAVIEQHGGVHATPAALVDIVPFLQTDAARYDGVEGAKPVVSIGEALVLKFEYLIKDAQVYTDEKFSVAGNNEGIFTAFSQTQADILLDDLTNENRNSHILLEGNAALAREYAKRVKEDMDVLKKSLDYGANLQFIRAVVTQNRILSEIDGIPTTFDFKGLSLDASAYIADYSNRGVYDNHRKTFRLMWGQQASYLEAQLFKDVAGLDSIATVQGLQFAYAHPETYTVHRITQANAGEIDQLQLSDNTKANMRTDVAAGNTIITPDKPVQDQNWRGILYVSLQPDWMGRYAIGEQAAQNGAWTTDETNQERLVATGPCDSRIVSNGFISTAHAQEMCEREMTSSTVPPKVGNNYMFIHQDKFDKSIECKIDSRIYDRLMQNKNLDGSSIPEGTEAYWYPKYGWPCLVDHEGQAFEFGDFRHYLTLSTEAANFYSPRNYDYWITDDDLAYEFKLKYQPSYNWPENECARPMKWENGRCFIAGGDYKKQNIHTYFGTYAYDDNRNNGNGAAELMGMGVYNPEIREVYNIPLKMHQKYLPTQKIQEKFVVQHLGYPTADSKKGKVSPTGAIGYEQPFMNGQMMELGNNVFILYGTWNDLFQSQGGVEMLGYPQSDVGPDRLYNATTQRFERKVCVEGACWDRIIGDDFVSGIIGFFSEMQPLLLEISFYRNSLIISRYQEFLDGIDAANDSDQTRAYFCSLYNIEEITAMNDMASFSENGDNSSPMFGYSWMYCPMFGEDITFYKAHKDTVREKLARMEQEKAELVTTLNELRDYIETHVKGASFSRAEWIGYFGADIVTFIAPLGAKLGLTVTKEISVAVAEAFSSELYASFASRALLMDQLELAFNRELATVGSAVGRVDLEDIAGRSAVASLKTTPEAARLFTRGGNPIRWAIDISNRSKQIIIDNGIRIETNLGRESAYSTEFLNNGENWVIRATFKGNITDTAFHSSNVILDQYYYALDRGFFNVRNIKLDKVVNLEAVDALKHAIGDIAKKEAFMKSPVGKMANWVIKDSGKTIDNVVIGDIVQDPNLLRPYTEYFNVEISLK